MELRNRKLSDNDFGILRKEALASWKTGAQVERLEDGFNYQRQIPQSKQFSLSLANAERLETTLTQPRAGVCLINSHITLLDRLETDGDADLLPTTIDSYTRQNRYEEAQTGIEESIRSGRSMLNGFPAVNYGVAVCREVTSSVEKPIQVRHGTPDARLLAEITLAGGFTAFEGGGISYNVPYAKNIPLETSLLNWQYVDRLVGKYAEEGIIINREPFGPLTGTLVPPSIVIAVGIIEGLLAAEQGVLDITLGYGQCGNLFQDTAAVRCLRSLFNRYLQRFGYAGVRTSIAFHQWMGGFPADEEKAFGVIAWGAAAASLCRATKVITKTPHEAMGIPTAEANIAGLKSTRQVLNMIGRQQPLESSFIDEEMRQIELETVAIIEATINLGEGDLVQGVVRAFAAGVLDVPFPPSRKCHGAVVPVRDLNGGVRIFEFGNLPFSDELKSYHRHLLERRAKVEHREVSFQMVTDDIYAVSKGRLVGTRK